MNDLYFFTSNRVKLAHVKYLGRLLGIDVRGFRERTYFGPYEEPRIRDRERLLQKSYESAALKWVVAYGETDPRIFFLEDTSVRIDALSSSNDDRPGVDVKYWMRGMTFEKLDAILKSRGNNRGATVRSDIVAHVPPRLRETLSRGMPYIWVSGETHGCIVEREHNLSTNLVYPWLDSQSFNKWFVPEGFDCPISALAINAANKCDFRKRAFDKVISSFRGALEGRFPAEYGDQLLLPGLTAEPPIIVICGYSCAGKTTLATWLASTFGFLHLEASDYMWKAYWERHGVNSDVKIGDFALAALQVEPGIAASVIANDIKRIGYPAVVITGFRSPNETRVFRALLGAGRRVEVLFLDASADVRFE